MSPLQNIFQFLSMHECHCLEQKLYKRFSSCNFKDEPKVHTYMHNASNSNLNCKSSFIHIKTHIVAESIQNEYSLYICILHSSAVCPALFIYIRTL